MAPAAIAEQLAASIPAHPSLESINAVNGYLNFEHHRHGWRNNSWKDDIEARAMRAGKS